MLCVCVWGWMFALGDGQVLWCDSILNVPSASFLGKLRLNVRWCCMGMRRDTVESLFSQILFEWEILLDLPSSDLISHVILAQSHSHFANCGSTFTWRKLLNFFKAEWFSQMSHNGLFVHRFFWNDFLVSLAVWLQSIHTQSGIPFLGGLGVFGFSVLVSPFA